MLVAQCVQLFSTSWTVAHQAPLPMEFSRQEYQSGLPFPTPGNLPHPGIEPTSPTLKVDSLLLNHQGKYQVFRHRLKSEGDSEGQRSLTCCLGLQRVGHDLETERQQDFRFSPPDLMNIFRCVGLAEGGRF